MEAIAWRAPVFGGVWTWRWKVYWHVLADAVVFADEISGQGCGDRADE